jgi:hypothetical protein
MIKLFAGFAGFVMSFAAFAAGNSAFGTIAYYETRGSGSHSLYLNTAVPTVDGCQIAGRGVVVDSDAGAKTMSAMIFFALGNGKQVSVRVDGCTAVNPGVDATTAPKIVNVQLLN